jgi:hypothetical protein
MPTRDDPLATLESELRALLERETKDVKAEAGRGAAALLQLLGPDLQKWASQLAAGEVDQDGACRHRTLLAENDRIRQAVRLASTLPNREFRSGPGFAAAPRRPPTWREP